MINTTDNKAKALNNAIKGNKEWAIIFAMHANTQNEQFNAWAMQMYKDCLQKVETLTKELNEINK